ncbi:hypothetical protein ACIBQX_04435 [Nonomuraea sp. NPDC049714]|uniref:hypothetical protein n=1 Tax=Nonomuraea sp. NPDC049714 TaxID=3364357 RepID=UPI0037BD6C1C
MHGDELKVPSQRAEAAHDGTQDDHEDPTYRAPYADTDGDMLVAADADTRAAPRPGSTTDPTTGAGADPGSRITPETGTSADTDSETVVVTETGQGGATDETPAHAAPKEIVLFDQDPTEAQARWRDLQASFVDDPGQAVHRADELVEEVVEALTGSLTARTGELRERWKSADGGDTEQLRLALRDYRGVLERLLALSEPRTR